MQITAMLDLLASVLFRKVLLLTVYILALKTDKINI
jgi:hypothetical protein